MGVQSDDEAAFTAARIEFGRRVRFARQELGKSLEGLAEGTAIHWSFLARVERGEANVTLKSLLRLAGALQVDPATLVQGLDTPETLTHVPKA